MTLEEVEQHIKDLESDKAELLWELDCLDLELDKAERIRQRLAQPMSGYFKSEFGQGVVAYHILALNEGSPTGEYIRVVYGQGASLNLNVALPLHGADIEITKQEYDKIKMEAVRMLLNGVAIQGGKNDPNL